MASEICVYGRFLRAYQLLLILWSEVLFSARVDPVFGCCMILVLWNQGLLMLFFPVPSGSGRFLIVHCCLSFSCTVKAVDSIANVLCFATPSASCTRWTSYPFNNSDSRFYCFCLWTPLLLWFLSWWQIQVYRDRIGQTNCVAYFFLSCLAF